MVAISAVALATTWGLLVVAEFHQLFRIAAVGSGGAVDQPNPNNHGPQQFIVISGYPLNSAPLTYSKQQVLDVIANGPDSVASFWSKNSYGQVQIVGLDGQAMNDDDVFGPYPLDLGATGESTCNPAIARAAVQAAKSADAGFTTRLFDGLRVIVLTNAYCDYGGSALKINFGAQENPLRLTFSISLALDRNIFGSYEDFFVTTHEVGHTLNLGHAGYHLCPPEGAVSPDDCVDPTNIDAGRGNPYDIMGRGGYVRGRGDLLGQSTARLLHQATWLREDPAAPYQLKTVTPNTLPSNATYYLSPLSSSATGLKAIRIPHGYADRGDLSTDPSDPHEYLYVEWHTPEGLDANIPSEQTDVFTGAMLHVTAYGNPFLIHPVALDSTISCTGASIAACPRSLHAVLPWNSSYTDPNTATTVSVGNPTPAGLLPVTITHLGRTDFDPPQNLQLAEVARPAPCTATYRATAEDASGISRIAFTLKTAAGAVTTVERTGSPAEVDVDLTAYPLGFLSFKAYDDAQRTGGIFENLSSSPLGVKIADRACAQQSPPPRVTVSSPDLPALFDTAEQSPYRIIDNTEHYYGLRFPGSLQSPIPLTFRVTNDAGLRDVTLYEFFNYSGADSGGYPTDFVDGGSPKLLAYDLLNGRYVHEVSLTLALDPGTHFLTFTADGVGVQQTNVNFFLDVVLPPPFTRGDTDADGILKITDAVRILDYLFVGGVKDLGCLDAADVNDDGVVGISDPIALLDYLFSGTSPDLPPPMNVCGQDPTPDSLRCASFRACGVP